MTEKRLAIFDFDKTLYRHDSVVAFGEFLERRGVINSDPWRPREQLHEFREVDLLLRKLRMVKYFEGARVEDFDRLAHEFVSENSNEVVVEIMERLQQHCDSGHEVVILSASFVPLVTKFCQLWKIPPACRVIGTELEVQNSVYTGRIKGVNCSGVNKLIKLKENLSLSSFDLAASFGYTDHISDVALLALVGHKVAVIHKTGRNDWAILVGAKCIHID
jgi:phosphatidylglycerophosphatase C